MKLQIEWVCVAYVQRGVIVLQLRDANLQLGRRVGK